MHVDLTWRDIYSHLVCDVLPSLFFLYAMRWRIAICIKQKGTGHRTRGQLCNPKERQTCIFRYAQLHHCTEGNQRLTIIQWPMNIFRSNRSHITIQVVSSEYTTKLTQHSMPKVTINSASTLLALLYYLLICPICHPPWIYSASYE
jgi:hypothetical protein